jgi:hypothetical protein
MGALCVEYKARWACRCCISRHVQAALSVQIPSTAAQGAHMLYDSVCLPVVSAHLTEPRPELLHGHDFARATLCMQSIDFSQ